MTEILLMLLAPVMGVVCFFIGRGRRLLDAVSLEQFNNDVPTLIREFETAKRKAAEYLAKIEEVIAERETWRALYNDQAGGHENAQALMLEAITKLLHVYKRDTGKSPQLDPLIELVRGEWVSVHGKEARENLGSDGKPKDSDRKPS